MSSNKLVRQSFSLSKEESEILDKFAKDTKRSRSEIIRMCIQGELFLKKVVDEGGKVIVIEGEKIHKYDPLQP
ncbi:ribbon-helix-helix protein, CopG family [Nostoc sp. FACHB-280]|uniref:ribbon-helix-helix protein, CopG family n=1 Tax=Nostoc sp. FACHB-280 TaxID=2692839 RepID=UPI00168B1668|nr:ribbon-helix-helix protein, CopG family [Nostoc sp. FACHB-280]MBD2498423.1 CopG family transcriptional regulator [Nostoc sp. FACHB-280]